MGKGHNSEALKLLEQFDKKNYEAQLLKSRILLQNDEIDEAYSLANQILEESKNHQQNVHEYAAIALCSTCLIYPDLKSQFLEVQIMVSEAEKLLGRMSNKEKERIQEYSGILLINKGMIESNTYSFGDYNRDLEFEGNLNLALNYLEQGVESAELNNDTFEITRAFMGIGSIFQKKGDFEKAMTYFQKGLSISKEFAYNNSLVSAYSYIGDNYLLQGDLDKSLDTYQKCLKITEKYHFKKSTVAIQRILGRIYFVKSNFDQSLNYFENSLALAEEYNYAGEISCNLFNLTLVCLEINSRDQAIKHAQTLGECSKNNTRGIINLRSELANALVLKHGKRASDKVDAQRILVKIIDEKSDDVNLSVFSMLNLCTIQELTVFAMLNLCSLLLDELENYGEEEVLEEAEKLSNQIYEIAQSQKSYSLVVQAILLHMKFSMIKGDFSKAEKLLEQGYFIAQEQGLNELINLVTEEREYFTREINRISKLAEQSSTMNEWIEQTRLKEYLETMLKVKEN